MDYESENRAEDRIKYLNYIARVAERLYRENGKVPVIRMIVIYTGDVTKAEPSFGMGSVSLSIEQVFVADLPADEIYHTASQKLTEGESLTEQELMQLIILPLAEKGREQKQERIRRVIGLAKRIENEAQQKLVLSGLLVCSDKFISRENAEAVRREISMTKVGRLLVEEGIEQGIERGLERGIEQGIEAFILDNLEEHVSRERIIQKLQLRFLLPEKEAWCYFEKYALVEQ